MLLAGAGYGKTTVLEQALADVEGQVAFVSCRSHEADAGRLLEHLVRSLAFTVPGIADELGERLRGEAGPVDARAAGMDLAADLDHLLREPLLIVFDDAEHLCDADDALELVGRLIGSSNRLLRVAIASRLPLTLPVARPTAQGRFLRLGSADLVFDAADCGRMLRCWADSRRRGSARLCRRSRPLRGPRLPYIPPARNLKGKPG